MSERPQQPPASVEVTPGVWVLAAQGNAFAVETPDGLVLVDTGPGGRKTDRMITELRTRTDAPVVAICYSHGHFGYNFGVPQWLAHNAERGDPVPRLVAHRNLPRRYARYRETEGYQAILNEMQFPGISAMFEPQRNSNPPQLPCREMSVSGFAPTPKDSEGLHRTAGIENDETPGR